MLTIPISSPATKVIVECQITSTHSFLVPSDKQTDEAATKQVWLAKKKVYFFAVFSNEFSDDLSPLSKIVDIEYGMYCWLKWVINWFNNIMCLFSTQCKSYIPGFI